MALQAGARPRTRVLTVAGTHSGGGAGVDADLRVFTLLGLWSLSAITSVNAQNSHGTQAVHPVPAAVVAAQIDAALADGPAAAVKSGQLSRGDTVRAVADRMRVHGFPTLVVDPVLYSSSGRALLDAAGRRCLITDLLPLATLVTPNRPEARLLLGRPGPDGDPGDSHIRADARRLVGLGCRAVLLKGGHADGPATDLYYDGQGFIEYAAERLPQPHAGGTGCTLSAAIAGYLALGHDLPAAIGRAKELVTAAIAGGIDWGTGGRGPCNAFAHFNRKE